MSQPKITFLWRLLTKRLDPTLILDVGANHGEVALSISYKKETRILMFEPNPVLTSFLEKSIAAHVNREQISFSKQLVSDASAEQEFFVDRKWSGTSSAVGPINDESNAFKGESCEDFERLIVPSISIDDALKEIELANQRLLFKIDVEGFESKVILGMMKTLSSVKCFAGIMEFDKELLQRAGTNPSAYFAALLALGGVWIFEHGSAVRLRKFEDMPGHADILISSMPEMLDSLSFSKVSRAIYPRLAG